MGLPEVSAELVDVWLGWRPTPEMTKPQMESVSKMTIFSKYMMVPVLVAAVFLLHRIWAWTSAGKRSPLATAKADASKLQAVPCPQKGEDAKEDVTKGEDRKDELGRPVKSEDGNETSVIKAAGEPLIVEEVPQVQGNEYILKKSSKEEAGEDSTEEGETSESQVREKQEGGSLTKDDTHIQPQIPEALRSQFVQIGGRTISLFELCKEVGAEAARLPESQPDPDEQRNATAVDEQPTTIRNEQPNTDEQRDAVSSAIGDHSGFAAQCRARPELFGNFIAGRDRRLSFQAQRCG